MAVRVRCLYETFFDGGLYSSTLDQDQVDYAINHPIMQRLASGGIRQRNADQNEFKAETSRASAEDESTRSRQISISSLGASISSFEEEEESKLLNRSRSLTHHHLRPLHLSPMQRTRISESVLSPISDKSENDHASAAAAAGQQVTAEVAAPAVSVPARRRPHLFPCSSKNRLTLNSSDSGISISANSLETSQEVLRVPSTVGKELVGISSSHEEVLSEPDLPFLMPKLKRSPGILQTLGTSFQQQQQQRDGRPLSLTLPFPSTSVPPLSAIKDLADDSIALEKQSWYHGSITRQDAEKRLKPTLPGTFLVRDSLASHHDYFLAARSENGFLHVRIDSNDEREFALSTLPERRFKSVPGLVNHCANVGIYCRHLPPLVLKYPLAEEAF